MDGGRSPLYQAPGEQHRGDGGVDYIFLTHRDDVRDAPDYAAHFAAERVIHEFERAAQPDAEIILEGEEDHTVGGARILFTPGHTKGHMVLLWRDVFLFVGDHFASVKQPEGLEPVGAQPARQIGKRFATFDGRRPVAAVGQDVDLHPQRDDAGAKTAEPRRRLAGGELQGLVVP